MATRIIAVIPARMGSSRFPGKPLTPICGVPMIEHVYHRTRLCRSLHDVYIATCDPEIAEAARGFGASVAMTSAGHERASDRVAEVAGSIRADVYVMIQGDEPMLVPEMIDLALGPIVADDEVACVNLMARILSEAEFNDPNTIKVARDRRGDALYFSRGSIPHPGPVAFGQVPAYKQVCLIPFRREFLLAYSALAPTPLEQIESIDMLRALEHGYRVRLVESPFVTHSVDTPDDAALVEQAMFHDPLFAAYRR